MTLMSGGQAAVKALETEETEIVFGLIGSATMEMFDALYDSASIKFVGVQDERTGTHMADGYARASGKAGVMLAGQNGPGATNLVTGLAQAKAAYSPLVSIAGMLAGGHVYRDAFQEVDQQSLFTPVTKKTWTAPSADRVPELIREAHRVALSPRRGPVQLNLPRDVLSAQAEFSETSFPPPQATRLHSLPYPDPALIHQAADMLSTARQPVIVVGGGIKSMGGADAVLELAATLGCPVVASPGHGDALPHSQPLYAGQMGPRGNPVASRLVQQADVILALGTRLGFNSTFYSYDNLNQEARLIHVELEPTAIGRFFPISLGIWADAKATALGLKERLETLNHRATASAWLAAYDQERKAFLAGREADADRSHPTQPSGLFQVLRQVLPPDSAITMDAGTLCLQATDAMTMERTNSFFTPLDFGLVGFSFACGLGVKLARPEQSVISLMGDGGFGMAHSELSTAVDQGINTVTLVMNNGCWGAEKAYQRDFFGGRYIGADISTPDFVKTAELYGAAGFAAPRLDDVAPAIEAALTCGKPAVVDISVDPKALYSFRRDSFKHRGG